MQKIKLSTVQRTANVLVLEMTPATILRIGKSACTLLENTECIAQLDPETEEEYVVRRFALDKPELYGLHQDLASFIMEIHDAILYPTDDKKEKGAPV